MNKLNSLLLNLNYFTVNLNLRESLCLQIRSNNFRNLSLCFRISLNLRKVFVYSQFELTESLCRTHTPILKVKFAFAMKQAKIIKSNVIIRSNCGCNLSVTGIAALQLVHSTMCRCDNTLPAFLFVCLFFFTAAE